MYLERGCSLRGNAALSKNLRTRWPITNKDFHAGLLCHDPSFKERKETFLLAVGLPTKIIRQTRPLGDC
jgi:hypothetical protein